MNALFLPLRRNSREGGRFDRFPPNGVGDSSDSQGLSLCINRAQELTLKTKNSSKCSQSCMSDSLCTPESSSRVLLRPRAAPA
jgi:hypothetical protein